MERKIIEDQIADEVVGGSIVFTSDHTKCGLNCNNQCKVNDYDACIKFIRENHLTMKEGEMLKKMVSLGYLTKL